MASIWKQPVSVATLTEIHRDTAVAHLGIEFLEVGNDYIRGRVPVDTRTRQPYGILHGGVSVVLAETLGSCGAAYAAARTESFDHTLLKPVTTQKLRHVLNGQSSNHHPEH